MIKDFPVIRTAFEKSKNVPIYQESLLMPVDSAHMRARNTSLILNLIWKERTISRAEISRRTGLSRSTVSAIVNQLLETGLVNECGIGDSSGGRRPIILSFVDDAFGLVGVDLGATHVGVVVTNLRGEVKLWKKQAHDMEFDPKGTIEVMFALIDACTSELHLAAERILGVGVAIPSPVDPNDRQGVLTPEVFPSWQGVEIIPTLERVYGVPVYIDNDANLGALAELWWGVGRHGGNLVFIKVGKGVGAGLIINGDIYRGSRGMAGEIGHIVVESSSQRVHCGMPGALTAYVGAHSLTQQVNERRGRHPDSPLLKGESSVSDIADAALAGDSLAREIVEDAGRYIGITVANILNLLNPEAVVLGGALTKVGDSLLQIVRKTIKEQTLWSSIAEAKLVVTELGEINIAVGAATQVLVSLLNDQTHISSTKVRAEVGR